MVDKFREILEQISERHGKVSVFALLKMDELTNKWSIILSANWITMENRSSVFREFVEVMNKLLTEEESVTIARIGLLFEHEHIVQELLRYKENTHITEEVQINGNTIHEAYILASNSSQDNS